jgi:hypothetical protein
VTCISPSSTAVTSARSDHEVVSSKVQQQRVAVQVNGAGSSEVVVKLSLAQIAGPASTVPFFSLLVDGVSKHRNAWSARLTTGLRVPGARSTPKASAQVLETRCSAQVRQQFREARRDGLRVLPIDQPSV